LMESSQHSAISCQQGVAVRCSLELREPLVRKQYCRKWFRIARDELSGRKLTADCRWQIA